MKRWLFWTHSPHRSERSDEIKAKAAIDSALRGENDRLPATILDDVHGKIEREFQEGQTFFVTGAGRSGTTSCIRILGTAENVITYSEPVPRMAVEIRRHAIGRLRDPRAVIWRNRVGRVREAIDSGKIYGEKDLQVFCWLPFYRQLFKGRFLFVSRDGRDVIRSFMDFHYRVNGTMYREVQDDHLLSETAREELVERLGKPDPVEEGRPRPLPGDPFYDRWEQLSRLQMIAWYWSYTNRVALRDLYRLGPAVWRSIDYSKPLEAAHFRDIFTFLDLSGFNESRVEEMLQSRINSIQSKFKTSMERYPHWSQWPDCDASGFDEVAKSTMAELGYYPIERLGYYSDPNTYRRFQVRFPADTLQSQVWESLKVSPNFSNQLSSSYSILWLGGTSPPPELPVDRVRYWPGGSVDSIPAGPFSMVIALGMVDRVPDMDRLLLQLANRTERLLVITASRGHFDHRIDHAYFRNTDGSWQNEWCTARAQSLLSRSLGFRISDCKGIVTKNKLKPILSCLTAQR